MPPGSRSPVPHLADLLAEAGDGVRPGPLELAELLWLARQLTPEDEQVRTQEEYPPLPEPPAPLPGARPAAEEPSAPPARHDPPDPSPPVTPGPARPAAPGARVPLHLPAAPSAAEAAPGGHRTLHVPAPPMLAHPLSLQRALRPLKRQVAAPTGHVLDEVATAHRIALSGARPAWWLPVLRPATERWLRLNLVYDTGPTMPVWRPLIRELKDTLAQSGIFRTVTVHRAGPDGRVHHAGTPAPVDNRTVTFLVSDCMGPQWRPGAAGDRWYALLRRWAAHMPLAVLQPLPEHLWRTTALPTTPGLLTAPAPAAPNATLTFEPYDTAPPPPAKALLPLPVLEPSGTWLTHWAQLVADAGGRQLPGSVGWLGHRPVPAPGSGDTSPDDLTPEELVLRFRFLASAEAFRLAGHLAVGRPELPVMRLVQAAVEPRPRPQHLAEVILSGVLTTAPSGRPGAYDFRPGVRELLLGTLPRTAHGRTEQLLARVGGLIEERAGRAVGEFPAVAPGGGTGPAPRGEAFATVREESVRRLGAPGAGPLIAGRYRMVRALGLHEKYWSAVDESTGETVVLRLGDPGLDAWPSADVPEHPHLVRVLDSGRHDGQPYLALEYVDGPNLASFHTNAPGVEEIATQLLGALTALHTAGVVHGRLVAENILVAPDGTPKISGFAPHTRPGVSREDDRRALGRILSNLADAQRWDHDVALSAGIRDLIEELEEGRYPEWSFPAELPYRPLRPEGLGGTTWRAWDEEHGRNVIVQVWPGIASEDEAAFRDKARRLRELRHDNVVRAYDHGILGQMPYLVTEYVPGVPLRELITQGSSGGLPTGQFLTLTRQLARAVLALHAEGVQHGDLTVNHILVAERDVPVLCGFSFDVAGAAAERDDLRRLGAHVQAMAGVWPTQTEPRAADLAAAPAARRPELARILADLQSGTPEQATRAAEALLTFGHAARTYRLFGRPRVEQNGATSVVGASGSPEESLFCALLLRPGQAVRHELGEEASHSRELLAHFTALFRRELGPGVVTAHSGGLVLHLHGDDTTDVQQIEQLTAAARRAREDDGPEESRRLVQQALDLMQEEPLAGVRGSTAREAQVRLRALMHTLQLQRAELDLELGRFQHAADDLEGFLLQQPGHQTAVRLRMLALRELGRTAEAIEVYEELRDRLAPEQPEGVVQQLAAELREAVATLGATVDFAYATPGTDVSDDESLSRAVSGVLRRAGLGSAQYRRIGPRHGGRLTVVLVPGASVADVLTAVVEYLTAALPRSPRRDRVLVTFAQDRQGSAPRSAPEIQEALDEFDTEAVVVVGFELQDVLTQESPDLFGRLGLLPVGDATGYRQHGWYRRLVAPEGARPLPVRGPFPFNRLVPAESERRAIVPARAYGALSPVAAPGGGPDRHTPDGYYEVDLTEHRSRFTLRLPSADRDRTFTVEAVATWHIVDPVRVVDTQRTDPEPHLEGLLNSAAFRITRRIPHDRPDRAQTDLHTKLRVPIPEGYAVRWATAVRGATAPQTNPAATALARAENVLLGFEGPLVHLYAGTSPRSATQQLTRLVTELRDVGEVLSGDRVAPRLSEGTVHPLDVLRTYATHPIGIDLRRRLDTIEARAVASARPTREGERLLRALYDAGRRVAVVSDTSADAMQAWLTRRSLPVPHDVFGRRHDLLGLLPEPDSLRRALGDWSARESVMIGSSPAEHEAARALGLPFIGYAYDRQVRERLQAVGCELIVDSLNELTAGLHQEE